MGPLVDGGAVKDYENAVETIRKQGGEIVELATRQIAKANAAAPRYFGRLPVAPCEVRAVEPYQEAEAPPAFYFPPAPDGSRGGIYLNFPGFNDDVSPELRASYGASFERLGAIKAKYDPENLFRSNFNIAPAATA